MLGEVRHRDRQMPVIIWRFDAKYSLAARMMDELKKPETLRRRVGLRPDVPRAARSYFAHTPSRDRGPASIDRGGGRSGELRDCRCGRRASSLSASRRAAPAARFQPNCSPRIRIGADTVLGHRRGM